MANGLKPPIPKHPLWMAYAIVFPLLALAFITSPIWGSMYGGLVVMRAIKASSRKHPDGNGRGSLEARSPGPGDTVERVAAPDTPLAPLAPIDLPSAVASGQAADHTDVNRIALGNRR
jgi:hypothetical protein